MEVLPYKLVCNGVTVAQVENLQLAKVLVVALLDNVSNIQDLHIIKVASAIDTPVDIPVAPQVPINE